MKFTLSWLKTHLDTDATLDEITATLTRIGLERADGLGAFTTWRPALPVVQWSVRKVPGQSTKQRPGPSQESP